MKIYESTFYQFALDGDRIVNRWKDTSSKMTFQDFKDALMNLAGFAIENRMSKILIDTNNFRFELPPENVEFRNKVFYPRVTKVGAVRQALVMPKEYLQYVEDELGEDVIVPTRYFSEELEAVAWLSE